MISIIVTNYNKKEMLERCISLIKRHTKEDYELIVVDDASTDGSAKMVKETFLEVTLVANRQNHGFAKSNNLGMTKATGELILLLNNDVEVHSDWEDGLLEAAKEKDAGIIGCKLLYPDGRIQHAGCSLSPWRIIFHGRGEADNGQYDRIRECDYVTGAAFLIKRAVVKRIGYLDEGYSPLYYEETDYCARARKVGFKVIYTPKTKLVHREGETTGSMPNVFYYRERSRVRFMLKNYSLVWLLLAVPAELLRLVKSVVKFRTGPFLRAYWHNLLRLGEIWEKRKNQKVSI